MNKVGTAYVLWLGCLLQLHGLHRLYNGKIFTGLLWMFTFGLFGFGQMIDLILIPHMVEEHNLKLQARQGVLSGGAPQQPVLERVVDVKAVTVENVTPNPTPVSNHLIVQLLRAAEARGGQLSVTHAVIDTGASFTQVEAALLEIVRSGYAEIGNHPETGVVLYEFREL
jgi:hypothetical protein